MNVRGGVDSQFKIDLCKYQRGDAPVRIENLCEDLFLKIHQRDSGQVTLINPFQSLLYTWDDPSGPTELIWNVYSNKKRGHVAQFQNVNAFHFEFE